MNPRIENLKEFILSRQHHQWRRTPEQAGIATLNESLAARGVAPIDRTVEMLRALLDAETPAILPGERIVLTRTITAIPDIFTTAEWGQIKKTRYLHEKGTLSNISADYATTLNLGLGKRREQIAERIAKGDLDAGQRHYLGVMLAHLELVQNFIEKYAAHAERAGEQETAASLRAIRDGRPATLRDALQLLRILHFMLWATGCYHTTLGRFDQYMLPFLRADIDSGRISREEAYDLVTEFFLSCNKDSDLYPGMQQGDNGQSIVLAGRAATGERLFQRQYRKPILIALLMGTLNQLAGINAILYYAPRIFEMSGVFREGALLQSIIVGLTLLPFTMLGMFLIDKMGRRKLIGIGSIGMFISLLLVINGFRAGLFTGYYMLVCLMGFIAFFAISLGATIWVVISEVFPNSVRAKGQVLGSMTHWVWAALLTWFFPFFLNIGPTYIFGFFAVMSLCSLFFALWMPETKNKSLEQIQRELMSK